MRTTVTGTFITTFIKLSFSYVPFYVEHFFQMKPFHFCTVNIEMAAFMCVQSIHNNLISGYMAFIRSITRPDMNGNHAEQCPKGK
jgi:hypothetical protein